MYALGFMLYKARRNHFEEDSTFANPGQIAAKKSDASHSFSALKRVVSVECSVIFVMKHRENMR